MGDTNRQGNGDDRFTEDYGCAMSQVLGQENVEAGRRRLGGPPVCGSGGAAACRRHAHGGATHRDLAAPCCVQTLVGFVLLPSTAWSAKLDRLPCFC